MAVANEDHRIDDNDEPSLSVMNQRGQGVGAADQEKNSLVAFREEPPDVVEVHIDEEELQARWYSTGEYFFIKKEALSLARRMSNTKIKDTNTITTRGLEIIEDSQVKQRKQKIDNVVRCVLDAQERSGSDPEILAPIYRQLSHSCITRSIESATDDARDAALYLADMTENSSAKGKPRPRRKGFLQSFFGKDVR